MKLLVLTNQHEHGHCYGADHLFAGLVHHLGVENVWDWPIKSSLHNGPDECRIDSDQTLPVRANAGAPVEELVAEADAVLLAVSPDHEPSMQAARAVCLRVPEGTPIVAVDFSDYLSDLLRIYEIVSGRPLAAYFKRELPIGADWAHPCPLSYPESRVGTLPPKRPRVFYHASTHPVDGAPGPAGRPRVEIVRALRAQIPASMRDVQLHASRADALPSAEYHQQMGEALVGVSWNGAPNWDCYRFWENFAYGLAQVAEKPRIQLPFPPEHMRHVYYVERVAEVATVVTSMVMRNPKWAAQIAANGHDWWRQHHTSEARAGQVLDILRAHG